MKKALLLLVFAVIAMGTIHGATITVTQPGGGEVTMTCPVQIVWTASGVTSNVRILLRRPGGALVGTIANNLPVSPGSYNWTVAAPAVVGESYKIHVRATDGSTEGASAVFTVKDPGAPPPPPPPPSCTLKIVSPNGGESWRRGSDQTISWTSTNLAGKVYLQLVRYNDRTLGTIKDNLPASGSITWKVGEYPGNTAPVGQYVIRVRSMADFKIFDESDAPFSLTLMIDQFKQPIALKEKVAETLLGKVNNYPGHTSFPKASTIPYSVYGIWSQVTPVECNSGGTRPFAKVGIHWFPYSNIQIGVIYRSRIGFPLSQFAGKSAELESAKLKMKLIHSVHEDANSGCGCTENLWVLMAPMTSFTYPAIGQRIGVIMGSAEFSTDITDIVKKWLDGSVANNGLLLLAGELPCSGGRTCFSCYEASLLLTMK